MKKNLLMGILEFFAGIGNILVYNYNKNIIFLLLAIAVFIISVVDITDYFENRA